MIIDKTRARQILGEEAAGATQENVDPAWVQRVNDLGAACQVTSKTYIAALGTGLLAKATDLSVDPLALKVKGGAPGAYSARALAKDVLAAEAPRLRIDLGVTGREPLNNQPFFRYDSISRDMDVRPNSRDALDLLCSCLEEAARIRTSHEARAALRSFLYARRKVAPPPLAPDAPEPQSKAQLLDLIERFVTEDSEGGKRAQAVAAGLLSLWADPSLIESARVNDPDRRIPGDIGIRMAGEHAKWERIFEVRDKPVQPHDLTYLVIKAHSSSVVRAGMLAVAAGQQTIETRDAIELAAEYDVILAVSIGWETFLEQVFFWSSTPASDGPRIAYRQIYQRLREQEVTREALDRWKNWSK